MTNTTGWPDDAQPGYPVHPERDGWHWINGTPRQWEVWDDGPSWALADLFYKPSEWAHRTYLGPCLTPTEITALVDQARREEREACVEIADGGYGFLPSYEHEPDLSPHTAWDYAGQAIAAAIRARSDAGEGA